MDCVPWNNCWIWQCTAALQSFCHPWCRLIKFLHLTLIALKAPMPSTDWVPWPPAVREPSAFPEKGEKYVFSFIFSLAFSQSSPKGNQVCGCTGGKRVSKPSQHSLGPCHPREVFLLFYCVSRMELTKQDPRRLPNAETQLKIEHNNYRREQPRKRVSGGNCFCFQTPHAEGPYSRSAQGWTPTLGGSLGSILAC